MNDDWCWHISCLPSREGEVAAKKWWKSSYYEVNLIGLLRLCFIDVFLLLHLFFCFLCKPIWDYKRFICGGSALLNCGCYPKAIQTIMLRFRQKLNKSCISVSNPNTVLNKLVATVCNSPGPSRNPFNELIILWAEILPPPIVPPGLAIGFTAVSYTQILHAYCY